MIHLKTGRAAGALAFVAAVLMASCQDESDPVVAEEVPVQTAQLSVSARETGEVPEVGRMAAPAQAVDLSTFALVLRDNENYYYAVNRRSSYSDRYWTGQAYYRRGSEYLYRGEVKLVYRTGGAVSIYYIDSRYDKLCLTTIAGSPGSSPAPGIIYFEPTDRAWPASFYKHSGEW